MSRDTGLTVPEYVATRCEDYRKLGGTILFEKTNDTGDSVKIHAALSFGAHAEGTLTVYEVIKAIDGKAVRHKYGYGARYDTEFLFRYDLDPDNHPEMPSHKHLPPGPRKVECAEVSIKEAADELWTEVLEREAKQDEGA